MTYLPPEHATVGEQLLVQYMGERYPVTVQSTDATSLFDPDNSRIRQLGRPGHMHIWYV